MTERFTLLSELGRGGMGVVWKARDEETGQIVALKLLRETYAEDPDYLARFERELELAKRIDSVNVVKVLGFGVRQKVPYLALEYVDGPSLHDALVAHGPYTWPDARALLVQIAQGLADANAAGVIHRDVKPSNVLIGPDGIAKLTDFGIARGLDLTRMTATSTLLGTPAYLAPEGPKDARSDLYSLGVIGYELLTGAVPFKGTSYQEVIVEHIRTAPDLAKLPPDARPTIGWLLAKDPADRPQRASALLPVLYGSAEVSVALPVAMAPALPAPAARQLAPVQPWDRDPPVARPRSGGRPNTVVVGAGVALAVAIAAVASVLVFVPGSSPRPSGTRPGAVSATSTAAPTPGGSGPTTVGSRYSDPAGKAGFQAMMDYCAQQTSVVPTINTVDNGTYQDQIKQYLNGTPDDVVPWFAGYRMNQFANQGLLTDISDVWANVDNRFSSAYKTASTASDGKQYLLPLFSYPWVVIYRKSVFAANGYTVPKTLDEFVTLAGKMKSDGLLALAFGDKDGWPAMGTFDILDLRMNGYDFHIRLLTGQEKWTDPKVKAVFSQWAKLLPITQPNAVGQVWQQAAQLLFDKKAGMYFIGSFATAAATPEVQADLAFFPFPLFGNQYDGENAIDAPIDGLMLSKAPANLAADKTLLECLATGPAELAYLNSDPTGVGANSHVDTSGYSDLQKQMATITAGSNKIAQFLDRDTRPDFAGSNGMQTFLADFLTKPNQDLDAYLKKIQASWDVLPPYSG